MNYMSKKTVIWLLVALVVVVGLYMVFASQSSSPSYTQNPPSNTSGSQPNSLPNTASNNPPAGTPLVSNTSVTKYVKIQSYTFGPDTYVVSPGTTIVWTNYDSVQHTVTSNNGYFASNHLGTGQSFSYKFTTKGTYYYHCSIHPDMLGRIIVQ